MKVTKVEFRKFEKDGLLGFATVILDDQLVVKTTVRSGANGNYVSFPSKKRKEPWTNPKTNREELYEDQVFPITAEFRAELIGAILAEVDGNDDDMPF